MLMVYVDDFKMSGKPGAVKRCWDNLRQEGPQGIKMDEPAPVNKCLGCDHRKSTVVIEGREYRCHTWNMVPFMQQCVE